MVDRGEAPTGRAVPAATRPPDRNGAATDDPTRALLGRGPVRFSLDGYDLVVVQDSQSLSDEGKNAARDLLGRLPRIAGCLSVGGDTYTIFTLEQVDTIDDGAEARQHPIDFLTQRELQIATLVMQGKVNKQIAYRLHIAPNTVQSHLKRIFCKLSVTSRAAMVARLAGCLHPSTPGSCPLSQT